MYSDPLSSVMNSMMNRLEYVHADDVAELPEDKRWEKIHIFVAIDPVLASLYKQYCDIKNQLGQLLIENGSDDPMTEIAWDMHDSVCSAIDTRMIELNEDETVGERVRNLSRPSNPIQEQKRRQKLQETPEESFEKVMVFMLLAGMAMKNRAKMQNVRRDFCLAS